jgi:hypothetical protein
LPYKDPNRSGYVAKIYGGCLMVRKDILDQVGWFDERFFMYGEDVDLCRKITDAGWKLYYLSESVIIHLCGGASGAASSSFSTLMKCESISKVMQKYYSYPGSILYRFFIFFGSSIRLIMLLIIKMLSLFSSIGKKIDYKNSFNKYMSMVKWSLNLQKPIIKT